MKKLKPVFIILCILAIIIATIDESVSDTKEQPAETVVLETESEINGEEQNNQGNKKMKDKKEAAKKEAEKKAKKEAEEKAKKEAEEKAKKKAEKKAKKEAEKKAKKEAEEKAKKEAEEKAKKKEEEVAEKDDESDFWGDAKKFVKDAVDTLESGTELVKGYSFKLNFDDDGFNFVCDACNECKSIYDDFEYKPHIFKGYAECTMSVSTRNKIRKSIKKRIDDYMEGAVFNEFTKVSVNDDLSKFTFWVDNYEKPDLMEEQI